MITFSLIYDLNTYEKTTFLSQIRNSQSESVFNSFSPKDFFELLANYAKEDKIELNFSSENEIQIKFFIWMARKKNNNYWTK